MFIVDPIKSQLFNILIKSNNPQTIKFCGKISSTNRRGDCYNLAIDKFVQTPDDEKYCELITTEYTEGEPSYNCYLKIAKIVKTDSFCKQIAPKIQGYAPSVALWECIEKTGAFVDDPTLCEVVEDLEKDRCNLKLAIILKNPSLCEKLNEFPPNYKQQCYEALGQ